MTKLPIEKSKGPWKKGKQTEKLEKDLARYEEMDWEINNTVASWIPDDPAKKQKMKESIAKKLNQIKNKIN